MNPDSVILDMVVEIGGNCSLSESGKTVIKHGVRINAEGGLVINPRRRDRHRDAVVQRRRSHAQISGQKSLPGN